MEIRPAQTHAELHACVDLQGKVWGFDPKDLVPFNQLHAAHAWGGLVLVAVEDGEVVGFCYGFGGTQYGRPALLSHMLAVLPEMRGRDLGAGLKLAQARWARERGLDLITWTYDPLESVNANLNLNRLGGVVRQYLVDHYGPMTDGLNRGLPSDRFLVEWHLGTPRVEAILAGQTPDPVPVERTCTITTRFQRIKREEPAEAMRWRHQVREEIMAALRDGYAVTGFRHEGEQGVYLLSRQNRA